jgi:hypothetical protein
LLAKIQIFEIRSHLANPQFKRVNLQVISPFGIHIPVTVAAIVGAAASVVGDSLVSAQALPWMHVFAAPFLLPLGRSAFSVGDLLVNRKVDHNGPCVHIPVADLFAAGLFGRIPGSP